jgi:hypothetical protein
MQVSGQELPPVIASQAGHARATDMPAPRPPAPEADFAKQVQAMQEIKFQELRSKGLTAQSEAMKRFQAGETDRALDILQTYELDVKESGIDADKVALLSRGDVPIFESGLEQLVRAWIDGGRLRFVLGEAPAAADCELESTFWLSAWLRSAPEMAMGQILFRR